MQRAARFFLWFGLALLIFSTASCGVGCLATVGEAVEGGESNVGGGIILAGTLALILSVLMLITGALLKAFSGSSREIG